MKRYIALFKQESIGCDYTIGCGRNWVNNIMAENMESAKQEVLKHILFNKPEESKYNLSALNGDYQVSTVSIFEVSDASGITGLDVLYKKFEDDKKKLEQEKKDIAEFERLKKKLNK